ncbi:MAG: LptF/LptG family permease [Acidobacteriota bacterium]
MRILTRYISKDILAPTLIALVVFSFFFLINTLFQLAGLVLQQGLGVGAAALLFVYALPMLLAYTLPMALLAGVIIAFSRLSADSEIVAMRAGGISLKKMLRAPILMGVLFTAVLLSLNLWLIPAARTQQDVLQQKTMRTENLLKLVKPGAFFDRIPGVLLYVDKTDLARNLYDKVIIFQHPGADQDMLTTAAWAKVIQSSDVRSLAFLLGPGESVIFDRREPGKIQVMKFQEQTLTVMPAQTPGGSSERELSALSLGELLWRMHSPPQAQNPQIARRMRYAYRFELQRRLAGSLIVLIFALIGVPLGLFNSRGGRGAGFSLSLGVVLGYWVVLSALSDFAHKGVLNPEAAAWLPDVLAFLVALYLLRTRTDRPRERRTGGLSAMVSRLGTLIPRRKSGARTASVTRSEHWISVTDRYLVRQWVYYFVMITGAILLIDWIIEVRGLSEFMTSRHQWWLLLHYLVMQSFGVFLMLLPLAMLMTVLVVLGILEKGNEITAMKAGGISLYRISATFLFLAVLMGALTWGMGEVVVPAANRQAQQIRDTIKHNRFQRLNSTFNVWLFAPDRGALFHYDRYEPKTKVFHGFTRYSLGPGRQTVTGIFYAARARFEGEHELNYRKGWQWAAGASPSFRALGQGARELRMKSSYFILPAYTEGQTLSAHDLAALIRDLKRKGLPVYQQKVAYYQKYADTATPLVLLLLGLPFAFSTGKRGSLYGVAIALGLAIVFYVLQAVFTTVGEMQWLDPALAAWAPVVIFGLSGGYWLLNLRS